MTQWEKTAKNTHRQVTKKDIQRTNEKMLDPIDNHVISMKTKTIRR